MEIIALVICIRLAFDPGKIALNVDKIDYENDAAQYTHSMRMIHETNENDGKQTNE